MSVEQTTSDVIARDNDLRLRVESKIDLILDSMRGCSAIANATEATSFGDVLQDAKSNTSCA